MSDFKDWWLRRVYGKISFYKDFSLSPEVEAHLEHAAEHVEAAHRHYHGVDSQ